jgi:hypothetical protein
MMFALLGVTGVWDIMEALMINVQILQGVGWSTLNGGSSRLIRILRLYFIGVTWSYGALYVYGAVFYVVSCDMKSLRRIGTYRAPLSLPPVVSGSTLGLMLSKSVSKAM